MSPAALIRITRPANSLAAGLAAVVAYLIATGTVIPAVLLLFLVVALVTAAGNVINDYFDVEIDRVNRPDRPIPSGQITPSAARNYAVTLFFAGMAVCLFTNELCIAIAVFNSLLLVAYAARLKRMPLVGNIAVSYLAASMFLFGGALAGMAGLIHVVPFAIMTFFVMLARELIKDAEDVDGDQASGAETVPIRLGIRVTVVIALFCTTMGALSSIVPFQWWGIEYVYAILVVDCILVYACIPALKSHTPSDVKKSGASTLLKLGMFSSLVVFTLSALFL
jgi:geranylgeranylglycerol-phosphate geranylgeranyltransferase